jgi:hypothetical protein
MTEAWLDGPIEGVPSVLMPAAHSFLQVAREIPHLLAGLSVEDIWRRHGASTSIGFHALHLAGATDRLLTYARGEQLSAAQLQATRAERDLTGLTAEDIVGRVTAMMEGAIQQLRDTSPESVAEPREVGRQRLPSTVLGLTFHAAEHATRHAGQIATLRNVMRAG